MILIPLNGHIEVEKLEQDSVVSSQSQVYEQKGKVVSLSPFNGVVRPYRPGDIVYFDGWMTAEYPDSDGKLRCLVPQDAIRAYETDEAKMPIVTSTAA